MQHQRARKVDLAEPPNEDQAISSSVAAQIVEQLLEGGFLLRLDRSDECKRYVVRSLVHQP